MFGNEIKITGMARTPEHTEVNSEKSTILSSIENCGELKESSD